MSMSHGSDETLILSSKMTESNEEEIQGTSNEVHANRNDGSDFIFYENKLKDKPRREPSYQDVNASFLQSNMINDPKATVQILPALLLCGGLPNSGKSEVIQRLFGSLPKLSPGFHHYEYIAAGFLPDAIIESTETNNPDLYNYGFLCGLKQKYAQENKQIGEFSYDSSECTLNDPILDKHLKETIEYLKKAEQNEMRQMIKGAGLINVWELTINSTTLHFLHCFSRHLYNSYTWLFTDIKRDRQILHKPPSISTIRGNTKLRKSRLEYLLRSSQLSSDVKGNRKNVCSIFATHTNLKRVNVEAEKLQKECQNAKKQLGIGALVNDEIIQVNFGNCNSEADLSVHLKQTIQTVPFEIPLSHMFLRGALYLEKSIFMRRSELQQKAMKCKIDELAFDEFCRCFTSFGSILDVSLVNSECNIVIIKPEEFLSKLENAFNPENTDDKLWREGIITQTSVVTLFGEEGNTFMEVLEAVGLVTDVTRRCSSEYADCSYCFYMPSIRKHNEILEYNQKSIQLKTSIRFPSVNLVIAITKYLLKHMPNSWLKPTENSNVTQICSKNDGFIEIIYQGGVIEFIVGSPTAVSTIINGCEEIAKQTKNSNRFGDPKYHFAVRCAKDTHLDAHNFSRKEHILPNDDLCDTCLEAEHPNTKAWIDALNKNRIDKEFKLDGDLTPDEALMLAKKIAEYPEKAIKNFELELKGSVDLDMEASKKESESLLNLMILEWKRDYSPKGSTKNIMTEILLRLHYQFKEFRRHPDYPEYDKVAFKELARTLDLQALTYKQIQHLHGSFIEKTTHKEIRRLTSLLKSNEKIIKNLESSQKTSDSFEGMITVGTKLCVYDAQTDHELILEECGLKLTIPAKVITPVDSAYKVAAQGLWSAGKFEFPEDCKLISGVSYISVSSSSELNKPVTVELMHCAHISDEKQIQYLSFVTAKSGPPFVFEYLPGGSFSSESQYGTISLKQFSLLAIVLRLAIGGVGGAILGSTAAALSGAAVAGTAAMVGAGVVIGGATALLGGAIADGIEALEHYNTPGKENNWLKTNFSDEVVTEPKCSYEANIFYKSFSYKRILNLVVIQDIRYSKEVCKILTKFGEWDHSFKFCFESDNILQLSGFSNDSNNPGWIMTPKIYPALIERKDADNFSASRTINPPHISVEIQPKDCTEHLKTLQCTLNIHGIELDQATIYIDMNQPHIVINQSPNDFLMQSSSSIEVTRGEARSTSDILEKPQENDLLKLIASINSKWRNIGIALGLRYDFLQGLEEKACDTIIKLSTVINEWMKNAEASFPVTWETVINAIEGPIINDKKKADEIRDYLTKRKQT